MTQALPSMLGEQFPALARYTPNLATISTPQALFLALDCQEAFYGGAAGGGKSDALLMAALQFVDVPGYAALLLRRTFTELSKSDGLIPRAEEWLARTDARRHDGGRLWTFPSGARLEFGHCQDEADRFNFQSAAYQFVGFDELTSFTESIYTYIAFSRSRRRMFGQVSKVPIRVRSASNPGNVGHGWVRERFVDRETRKRDAVFIPAKISDNPGLDQTAYRATLAHLSEELQAQLLHGDWNAAEGMALPKFGDANLVDAFPLASSHDRIECMDYGLNGTAWSLLVSDYDGSLIFYDQIVEADKLPDEIAPLVIAKRKSEWGFGHSVYADPSLWHRTGQRNKWGAPAMLADEFTDHGVSLIPANNDPRAGLIRLRTLVDPDPERRFPDWHPRRGEYGAPRLFVVEPNCRDLVKKFRSAPLQPIGSPDGGEKIDPTWESRYGHQTAQARYGCMAKPSPSKEPPPDAPVDPGAWRTEEIVRLIREEDERMDSGDDRNDKRFVTV